MVHKKTGWYSFVAPLLAGCIAAGAPEETAVRLARAGMMLGVAFQIQDDVLNLAAVGQGYGKEENGDLWEGKHTLILTHALRAANEADREKAIDILGKARPGLAAMRVAALAADGRFDDATRRTLLVALDPDRRGTDGLKSAGDIAFLRMLVERGSLDYARRVADRYVARAATALDRAAEGLPPSVHLDFLRGVVHYVRSRAT